MKTINKIIGTHCYKELSPATIFKVLKGIVSRSSVYKAVKIFWETGGYLPKPGAL